MIDLIQLLILTSQVETHRHLLGLAYTFIQLNLLMESAEPGTNLFLFLDTIIFNILTLGLTYVSAFFICNESHPHYSLQILKQLYSQQLATITKVWQPISYSNSTRGSVARCIICPYSSFKKFHIPPKKNKNKKNFKIN